MSTQRQLRYQKTEKGKVVARRAEGKYRQSDKGKARTKRYTSSEKGKATRSLYQTRQRQEAVSAENRA